jgi:hypothetical protein
LLRTNDARATEDRESESAVNQLRRSEAYLAEAQRLTKTGSWAWTPGSDEWNYWSDEMFRSFEFDPRQSPPMVEMSRQRIHPAGWDWQSAVRLLNLMADACGPTRMAIAARV